MALDLQKLVIRRLLESTDSNLFSKTTAKYFTGSNLILYGKMENFYRNNIRLPNTEEFKLIRKDISLQDYLESQILSDDNKNDNVDNEFLVAQLQDFCIRDETINFLEDFLDNLNDYEKVEILDKFQMHLMELNRIMPTSDELIDVGAIEVIPSTDTFEMYPSGLSHEYDAINGGFSLQELVCFGGRRGSGKSIIALNVTLDRFLSGHTTALFSIEMRYVEVYYRTMSILTRIPFLSFMQNKLTHEEKYIVAKKKMDVFYQPSELINELLVTLKKDKDLGKFNATMKIRKPKMKENRFFIIDDPTLSINRIDHYCNIFTNKYPKFTMSTIDYLNIIAAEESRDWKTQIIFADSLKAISRKYNQTVFTPYQIDSTEEARFAKGILDAADRAFTFMPKKVEDPDYDVISIHTAKIRNGKNINFDIGIDWDCVRIDPTRNTSKLNQGNKLLNAHQFGSDVAGKEGERDLG